MPAIPLKKSLSMRPARPADQRPIADLIHARSEWMRQRGMPDWSEVAEDLAAQAAHPDTSVWVLTRSDAMIGCTSLFNESPAWFWTAQERAEPAIFMASTVTHPRYAGQRLGCQLAWWVLDYAARTGRAWVRRGTIESNLVRYYRDVQGWRVIRQIDRDSHTVVGLARRATLMPDLAINPFPRGNSAAFLISVA